MYDGPLVEDIVVSSVEAYREDRYINANEWLLSLLRGIAFVLKRVDIYCLVQMILGSAACCPAAVTTRAIYVRSYLMRHRPKPASRQGRHLPPQDIKSRILEKATCTRVNRFGTAYTVAGGVTQLSNVSV